MTNDTNQFGIKVDDYLGPHDTLNFSYMFYQLSQLSPLSPGGASVPGFPVAEDQRAQSFVAQDTHAFSPSLIAVGRFSFLRNKFLFGESQNHEPPSSLGFQYTPSLDVAAGPPFIQVSGYTLVGNPITGPRNTYENVFDYSGSLSWVHGKHALKFGGGYQHQQINVLQGIATNGFFVFAPFPVTDAFASFLTGQPVVFLQGIGDFSRNIRGNNANGYVQDTYKVAPRFTINAGLRYELPLPYTEIRNRVSLFEPGKQSTVMPDAPAGLLYPGDSGVPAGLIPTDYKAFAPRVGIAWDPSSNGKSLVTSAYGIFYEPYYTGQGGPLQAPISAPPYLGTPQVSLPNFADPFNGNPPAPGTFSKPLTNLTLSPTLTLPYTQDWDLNLQQSFGTDWLFEIGYVGTKGTRLPALYRSEPSRVRSRNRGRPANFEFQQCRSTAALFRLHARRSAEQLPVFIYRRDRGHRQFVVQRVGNVAAQAVQPRAVIPPVVHMVKGDRRCFVIQHNRIGGKASRRRKRSRPESVRSCSRAWAVALRRAQPIRWELCMGAPVLEPSSELVPVSVRRMAVGWHCHVDERHAVHRLRLE